MIFWYKLLHLPPFHDGKDGIFFRWRSFEWLVDI